MDPVLFTSQRDLSRAENIRTVYRAYDGPKDFIKLDYWRRSTEITSGKYKVMVTDEIPAQSPGKVILIGHGIAGTKLFGLDQPRPYATRANTALITYVITQSPDLVAQVAKQHGVELAQVLPLGMARTDAFYNVSKGDGGTGYSDKRVYLYAPTYRQKQERTFTVIDWQAIDSRLNDNEIMLVKPHMLTPSILTGSYRHIKEISNKEPSTPYIIDCDVLLTDFSSILMDGLAARKPVVLFSKDNSYLSSRGMYFSYPEDYSEYYCDNEYALVDILRRAVWTKAAEDKRRFFVPTSDGRATERLIQLIQEVNNENSNSSTDL